MAGESTQSGGRVGTQWRASRHKSVAPDRAHGLERLRDAYGPDAATEIDATLPG